MSDEKQILLTAIPKDNADMPLFLEVFDKSDLKNHFDVYCIGRHTIPYYFNQEFLEHILTNGFSSLFNYKSLNEDILSSSFEYSEIENVILKFLSQLNGSKKIIITDPYMYNIKDNDFSLFEKIIKSFCSDLVELTFITDKRCQVNKSEIHAIIKQIKPSINIIDFNSNKFHDRFWIGLDTNIGIVIGTSLNGVSKKKIALIDRLSPNNVEDIIKELNELKFVYPVGWVEEWNPTNSRF